MVRRQTLSLTVSKFFESQPRQVFRESDLARILMDHEDEWNLPVRLRALSKFKAFLLDDLALQSVKLKSEHYRDATRYVWGPIRPYDLALSLGKKAYFSHATAVFLRGLTDQIPKTIYVNDEQTPKHFGHSGMTQQGIDRAFAGKQRTSRAIFTHDTMRALLISGKATDRLEVSPVQAPDGTIGDATKVERTLIDIAVRPDYAGGPQQVLAAYAAAKEKASVHVLVATLKKLEYAYPYHQVIGFYMSRAGYGTKKTELLKRFGFDYKFYLTYGMKSPDFDSDWQLFIPKGF